MKSIYRPVLAMVLGGLGIAVMASGLTWLTVFVAIAALINAARLLAPVPAR
jgi:hypothetical protein